MVREQRLRAVQVQPLKVASQWQYLVTLNYQPQKERKGGTTILLRAAALLSVVSFQLPFHSLQTPPVPVPVPVQLRVVTLQRETLFLLEMEMRQQALQLLEPEPWELEQELVPKTEEMEEGKLMQ